MTATNPLTRLWQIMVAHRWQLVVWFVVVLVPLALFAMLAEDVWTEERFAFDDPILLYAHSHATPILDLGMLWVTRLGYAWGVVPVDIVVGIWLLVRHRWRDSAFFIVAVGGAALLNLSAKALFGRERPKLWPSIAPEHTFSFPSGHAMGSTALAVALIVLLWPTRWRYLSLIVGIVVILLVGASRIYLGVHYPSDILAGWLASLAWVVGTSGIVYRSFGRPRPS